MSDSKWITVDCCVLGCGEQCAIPEEPPHPNTGASPLQHGNFGWKAVFRDGEWRYHCQKHPPGPFLQSEPSPRYTFTERLDGRRNVCRDGVFTGALVTGEEVARLGVKSKALQELAHYRAVDPGWAEMREHAKLIAAVGTSPGKTPYSDIPPSALGWNFGDAATACRCAVCGVDIPGNWSNAGQFHGPMGDLPPNGGDDEFLALCPTDYARVADYIRGLRRLPEGQTSKEHPRDLTSDWDLLPDAD